MGDKGGKRDNGGERGRGNTKQPFMSIYMEEDTRDHTEEFVLVAVARTQQRSAHTQENANAAALHSALHSAVHAIAPPTGIRTVRGVWWYLHTNLSSPRTSFMDVVFPSSSSSALRSSRINSSLFSFPSYIKF